MHNGIQVAKRIVLLLRGVDQNVEGFDFPALKLNDICPRDHGRIFWRPAGPLNATEVMMTNHWTRNSEREARRQALEQFVDRLRDGLSSYTTLFGSYSVGALEYMSAMARVRASASVSLNTEVKFRFMSSS